MKSCFQCGNSDIYPMVYSGGGYFCELCGCISIHSIEIWEKDVIPFAEKQIKNLSKMYKDLKNDLDGVKY
jgi:hypothetical protein